MLRFFPAAGLRNFETGVPVARGRGSYYWTSSSYSEERAWYLEILGTAMYPGFTLRTHGLSVRCVA